MKREKNPEKDKMGKILMILKESNLVEPLKAKRIRELIPMDLWVLCLVLMLLKIKISSNLTMKIQLKTKNLEQKDKPQQEMEQVKHQDLKRNPKLQAQIKDRYNLS